jgi:nitrous oxidase accessory protein NosD
MKTVSLLHYQLLPILLDVHLPLLPVVGQPLRAMPVVHLPLQLKNYGNIIIHSPLGIRSQNCIHLHY